MNKLAFVFLFNLITFSSISQNPMAMGGNRGMGGQQMNGRMYGKVIDSLSGKGVDAASIQLIQNKLDTVTKKRKDVVIGGMLTKANGEFSLENIPVFGQYKLKISAIGFIGFEKLVGLT